jgi:hypothetical protein
MAIPSTSAEEERKTQGQVKTCLLVLYSSQERRICSQNKRNIDKCKAIMYYCIINVVQQRGGFIEWNNIF